MKPSAYILAVDGTCRDIEPANGKWFTLEEMQAAVGGYVQPIRMGAMVMLCDEDGLPKGLPKNEAALEALHHEGIGCSGIVGPVLVCRKDQLR